MSYILNIKVNNLIQLVNSLVINSVTNPLTSTIVGAGFNINNVNTVGLINIGVGVRPSILLNAFSISVTKASGSEVSIFDFSNVVGL